MQPLWGNVATLAVAFIFYTWKVFDNVRTRKHRVLSERVAYMLWVMANQGDTASETLPLDAI